MLLENFGKKKRVVDSSRSAEELCGSTNGTIRGHLLAAPCLKSGIFLDEKILHLMNLDLSQKNLSVQEGMGVVVYRIERKPIWSSEYLIRIPAPTFSIPILFAKTCPATSPLSSCSRSILQRIIVCRIRVLVPS
jgi:hypothetical protein